MFTDAYIHWDVSPTIFQIGALKAKYYGLFFSTLFLAGYLMLRYMFRLEKRPEGEAGRLVVALIIGTVAGLRLGHVLFYNPVFYLTHPLEIFMVWKGGLASHGAAIGILLALLIFRSRKKRPSLLWYLDRIVVPAAFGAFLIRTGNLMNSEIIGTPTTLPWAFIFERIDPLPRHPAQLYEAVCYLIIFSGLALVYRRNTPAIKPGRFFGWFLTLVFICRFFIEFVKENQSAFEDSMALNMGQLLSIPFAMAGVAVLIWSYKNQPHKSKGHKKTRRERV